MTFNHIRHNIHLYVFLVIYFFTAVLGNLLYPTEIGYNFPTVTIREFWKDIDLSIFRLEFFALLFLPFIVIPIWVWLFRRHVEVFYKRFLWTIPDIKKEFYIIITLCMYGYIAYKFYQANAHRAVFSFQDPLQAVEVRFDILKNIGFFSQVILMSLLPYTAVYAVVVALRKKEIFWYIFTGLHTILLSLCLLMLQMKWPILVFLCTIFCAVFILSRSKVILPFFIILPVVFVVTFINTGSISGSSIVRSLLGAKETSDKIYSPLPYLGVSSVNRMAIAIPYYYSMFSGGKNMCGSMFDPLLKKEGCAPSKVVYEKMFKDVAFSKRGTAPAASHITGYALDGWFGALFCIVLVSSMIVLFLALGPWIQSNMLATIYIMGCQAVYFWTQLPIEAPVIYAHGILWWGGAVILYNICVWLWEKLGQYATLLQLTR